jgi:hypothetical protein
MPERNDLTQDDEATAASYPGDDVTTAREELELDLMDEGASEAGEVIGEPTD